jgi:hypothetical protein
VTLQQRVVDVLAEAEGAGLVVEALVRRISAGDRLAIMRAVARLEARGLVEIERSRLHVQPGDLVTLSAG